MNTNRIDKQADPRITQKIQTLIIGRLLTIFLLLVSSWLWNSGHLNLSYENIPQGLFLIFLISVGLTIVYFFVLRLSSNYDWQLRIQFLLDILLVTWLIWSSGDVTSPYITLYIVLISVAGIFLGSRATLLMAAICVSIFTLLAILTTTNVIRSFSTAPEISKVIQIVGFHVAAFLIVGLLSARLAERHASSEKLEKTAKTLADLRVLNERIVESIRSGLVTTDLDGKIYTFNKAAEEITGYEGKNVRGTSVFELFGDIKREVLKSLSEDANLTEYQPRYEIGFTTPDGFVVQLGYSVSPLFAESGEKTGLIITFQDLTEIRSMEESVRRKDRLAAVGRVAAGLAHEIRNPLGAMRGSIQVLKSKSGQSPSQTNLMGIILRESDRLNEIITNFLKYARPQTSSFNDIDLREPIRDTFTLLQHSPDVADNHMLEMVLPDEPFLLSADVSQLKQIFWNLSRNAIQAMDDGGTLNVELSLAGKNRAKIVFSDTGCGMSPKQVEQLFEPFSKSTTGGTGLGLSIVYQIVRDHNGTINVSSKEGKGTTITMYLPIEGVKASAEGPEQRLAKPTADTNLGEYLNVKQDKHTISS
ncbi:MAG: PAS domain S-box protein [Pyrinomonadaceae bacterium]|nr:PAS domain S-box protein [Pyrinomonadaceae bacterium]